MDGWMNGDNGKRTGTRMMVIGTDRFLTTKNTEGHEGEMLYRKSYYQDKCFLAQSHKVHKEEKFPITGSAQANLFAM